MGGIFLFAVLVVACSVLAVVGKLTGVSAFKLGVGLVVLLSFAMVLFAISVMMKMQ